MIRLALAGDTMLGRMVGEKIAREGVAGLFSPAVVEAAASADLFVLNLECCISERGAPWPDPHKPFFFRAPPRAVEVLTLLGVDAVTLANNHAVDFGYVALADTLDLLHDAGIATVGAGMTLAEARRPVTLRYGDETIKVVAFSDHPADFAATDQRPGVAYADLRRGGVPDWLVDLVAPEPGVDGLTLVTPHWGPNMVPAPLSYVREAAARLRNVGADLIAGHSAHVFHGAAPRILFDLGDFIDDYAVDPVLRNDLGLLWFVTVEAGEPVGVEALPLALDYCHTRAAAGEERAWIANRLRAACRELGTEVTDDGTLLTIEW